MRPANRTSHPVPLRLAVAEAPLPGRQAKHHLPVPIASTLYTRLRKSWGATLAERRALVGCLAQNGWVKQAKKLTFCGVTPTSLARDRSKRRRVLGCHSSLCPVCARLRQNRIFSRMRPWVEGQMGELGRAALLKLAIPDTQELVIDRLTDLADEVRSITGTRAWRKFSGAIGVVMTLEVGRGSTGRGHPHAHLFVYSNSGKVLDAFLDWLKIRWSRRVKRDLIEGADLIFMGPDPSVWAPRLHYILKGNRVDPDWPLPLMREVIEAITSGKHLFSVWGLAKRPGGWTSARFASNIRVFRPSYAQRLLAAG